MILSIFIGPAVAMTVISQSREIEQSRSPYEVILLAEGRYISIINSAWEIVSSEASAPVSLDYQNIHVRENDYEINIIFSSINERGEENYSSAIRYALVSFDKDTSTYSIVEFAEWR